MGDNAAIYLLYWKYKDTNSGKLERSIKFKFHFLNFMRRVNQEPLPEITPNPSGLFRAIYMQAMHCTTGQFKGQVDPSLNPVNKFTLQNLRASGR